MRVPFIKHPSVLARSLVLLALLWMSLPGRAFPPAPNFTIHGVARDPFGWAIRAVDQGVVVIKRNGAVIVEAPIDEAARAGENFRVRVPMDSATTNPYKSTAQTPGVSFTLEVRFPTQTLLVSSLTASQRSIGQPGGMLFLDFTVGVDSDGDGIPDAWEWWQLGEMGIAPGDPRWSLQTLGGGDYDRDGTPDYVEYLAGTFAFLAEDSLRLKIEGLEADRSARLRTLVVTDKVYRIETTTDLVTWTTASVRVDSPTAGLGSSFTLKDTREVVLYAPSTDSGASRFYRLKLLR